MKVLIVGGGPAGSLSAITLGKDRDIVIVEEHQSAGFPTQCAGLISGDCYKILRRFSDCKINDIRGAFFVAPNGDYVELEGRSKGVVIERKILDRDLLAKASEFADVWMKSKFVDAKDNVAKIVKHGETVEVSYDFMIGADGAYSTVARCFGFERPHILSAVQIESKFEALSDDMVELFFGNMYSNGFFAYAIPLDETARIGVVSKDNPRFYLENLIRKHPSASKRIKSSKIIELNAGAIPIGLIDFVKDNVALIGDSAGMVKPYTGGGLFYILKASEILGKNFPKLREFKEEFLKVVGKEFSIGMRIFKLYSLLEDEDYNYLVKVAKEYTDLARGLHMDKPSTLLRVLPTMIKIVRRPRLMVKLLEVLAS